MEPKRSEMWVDGRMAVLDVDSRWEPCIAAGRERFDRARIGRRRRVQAGLGVAAALVSVMAFPSCRVLAQRCVDACVAETVAVGQLLSFSDKAERRAAPEFSLMDHTGHLVRLADFRGKVVLLNFWATWCPPCKQEMPWFAEFQQAMGAEGLVVLGVVMDEERLGDLRPMLDGLGVHYPVVPGNDEIARRFGGIASLPTTFLIDREGRIAVGQSGLVAKSVYERELRRLLAEGR